jgi:hypothetical protein
MIWPSPWDRFALQTNTVSISFVLSASLLNHRYLCVAQKHFFVGKLTCSIVGKQWKRVVGSKLKGILSNLRPERFWAGRAVVTKTTSPVTSVNQARAAFAPVTRAVKLRD